MCSPKGNSKWISMFEGQQEGRLAENGANTVLRFALVTKTSPNQSHWLTELNMDSLLILHIGGCPYLNTDLVGV